VEGLPANGLPERSASPSVVLAPLMVPR